MDLTEIDISLIEPNPDNPRGIDIEKHDTKLSYLKDSIRQLGVLVPIVVTPRDKKYLLVDGERRYYAAKSVGLAKLPAYVLTPRDGGSFTSRDLLFRMFQIHHQREQWGPVQQCGALEAVYDRILKRADIQAIADVRASLKAITDRLATDTGIDERTAWDRVKFLRWPKDVKNKLYSDPTEKGYWYICEIEEKIIIPSLCNFPEYFKLVDEDDVRRDLFTKLNVALERATEVRKVAPFFRAPMRKTADHKAVTRVLDRLRKDVHMTYADAEDELTKALPQISKRDPPSPRRLQTIMANTELEIESFDPATIRTTRGKGHASAKELHDCASALDGAVQKLMDQIQGGWA